MLCLAFGLLLGGTLLFTHWVFLDPSSPIYLLSAQMQQRLLTDSKMGAPQRKELRPPTPGKDICLTFGVLCVFAFGIMGRHFSLQLFLLASNIYRFR